MRFICVINLMGERKYEKATSSGDTSERHVQFYWGFCKST